MELLDIILSHGKSKFKSRSEVDTSITCNDIALSSPVVLSNMETCQNKSVLDIFNEKKWPYVYHRLGGEQDILDFVAKINLEQWHLKSISVGVSEKDKNLLTRIKNSTFDLDWITIDVALIYNEHFEEYIKWVRKEFPDVYLIAGNFAGSECANWLANMGVDCGKTGIGKSALCKTRQYTGFGSDVGHFIEECDNSNIDLMFDGGLTILDEEKGEIAYGDIFKAIGIGAKWVMSSSLFRWAHELSDHGVVNQYGNSTARAKGHRSHEEGAVKSFKSQYDLEDQMRIIKEHLQSSVSYSGRNSLEDCQGYLIEEGIL
jgi:GMP reductase